MKLEENTTDCTCNNKRLTGLSTKNMPDIHITLAWIILMAAGMTFLILNNTHEGISSGEAVSAQIIKHPVIELMKFLPPDSQSPLYYLMLKAFSLIFGESIFVLRIFSAMGTFALAGLGFFRVRKIFGEKEGLAFSFLVFATPAFLTCSQEIEMYTWAAFFVTGCFIYGYMCVKENLTKDWIVYSAFFLAACYTHYYAMAAVAIINTSIAVILLSQKEERKISKFAYFTVVNIEFCFPAIIHIKTLIGFKELAAWIPHTAPGSGISALIYPFSLETYKQLIMAAAAFICLFVLIMWGVYAGKKAQKPNVFIPVVGAVTFLLPTFCGIVLSLTIWPALYMSYIVPMLGVFLLSVTYAMSFLNKRRSIIICTVILILFLPQLTSIENGRFNGPITETAEYIKLSIQKEDCLIHTEYLTVEPLAYYFPSNSHFKFTESIPNYQQRHDIPYIDVSMGRDINSYLKRHKNKKNIWIVNDSCAFNRSELAKWLEAKGFKLKGRIKEFKLPDSKLTISVCKVTYE